MQVKEEIDTRQGRSQILSNISVLSSISSYLTTSLGPRGLDKLFDTSFSNDGLFILSNLPKNHPIHFFVLSLAQSQDSLSGDGTTSVILLLREILECLNPLIKNDICGLVSSLSFVMERCLQYVDEFLLIDDFQDSDADSVDYFNLRSSQLYKNGSTNGQYSDSDSLNINEGNAKTIVSKFHNEKVSNNQNVLNSECFDSDSPNTNKSDTKTIISKYNNQKVSNNENVTNSECFDSDFFIRNENSSNSVFDGEISNLNHKKTGQYSAHQNLSMSDLLLIARTPLCSKILKDHADFFAQIVVRSLKLFDNQNTLNASHSPSNKTTNICDFTLKDNEQNLTKCMKTNSNLSFEDNQSKVALDPLILKVPGGSFEDSFLFEGIAFQKTFSYAGYEQLLKTYKNPKIILTTVELEWMAEKENAEVVVSIGDYQKTVDAEYSILKRKLDFVLQSKANIILSSRSIGDYATQYFAKNGVFCAGRVPKDILKRIQQSCGGRILTNLGSDCSNDPRSQNNQVFSGTNAFTQNNQECGINMSHFEKNNALENDASDSVSQNPILASGTFFEERQLGKERYNFLSHPNASTIILRGPGKAILGEMERSLVDSLSVVKKNLKGRLITGGGSLEMFLAKKLLKDGKNSHNRFVFEAIGKAFENFVGILAKNMGLNPIHALDEMRKNIYSGISPYGVRDMRKERVFEPASVKKNIIIGAFNGAMTILSIDCTIFTSEKNGQ